MNNIEITTDPSFLCTDLNASLNTSSSVARFLPEEDVSTYPLLSKTPSPPPIHFNHPLRQNTIDLDDASNDQCAEDNQGETSSNSESSGIGMDVQVAGTTTLFNQNVYQHLGKNGEATQENSEVILHANLNIPVTKDAPSFVHWNWPLIRKCTFFCFIASVFAMVAVVVSMISALPKTCNPGSAWFRGSVFLQIDPFDLAENDSSDIPMSFHQLENRIDSLVTDNLAGIRLNSMFASHHIDGQQFTSILELRQELGKPHDFNLFAKKMNGKNLALLLDLPLQPAAHQLSLPPVAPIFNETGTSVLLTGDIMRISRSLDKKMSITDAIQKWLHYGVDGFYMDGLEKFYNDPLLLDNVRVWKKLLGPERVLIVNYTLLENVNRSLAESLLSYVDLVVVELDTRRGAKKTAEQIKASLDSVSVPGTNAYIQWSLSKNASHATSGADDDQSNSDFTLASTLFLLMLPGSPCLSYDTQYDTTRRQDNRAINFGELNHYDRITNAIQLRAISPSIYQSKIEKGEKIEPNTSIKISKSENVLIVERWYPRRNTFVGITNLGPKEISMDLSDSFYSGEIIIGRAEPTRIYFREATISPIETVVIKLDK